MYKLQPQASLLAATPSRKLAGGWNFYICATARMDGERMRNANFLPSPLGGRGWTASGVLISRGGTGEGVETVSSPHPYRKTRSLARTGGRLIRPAISVGMVLEAPELFVERVVAMG